MTLFAQLLVAGVALGSVFALVASGIVVIARVSGAVNFSQGIYVVVGGFIASSSVSLGLPPVLAVVVALVASAALGVLGGVVVLGRRNTTPESSMILSLGFGILLYAPIILIWGDQPRSLDGVDGSFGIGGVSLSYQYALIIAVTAVVFIAMQAFFARSYLGKAMTACSSNPDAARAVGINVRSMSLIAFAIAGLLGGTAGVLLMPVQPLAFNSDMSLALNGFAAAVFGQLSRPVRALVGALILGVLQSLVAGYISASYQLTISLVLLVGVMIWQSRKAVMVA